LFFSLTATTEKSPAREVLNQPPPLEGYNVYESNVPLVEAMRREGAEAFEDRVRMLGQRAGTAQSLERGRLANENPPILRTHDRYGNRIDEVEFHPAWHELLDLAVGAGVHALCPPLDQLALGPAARVEQHHDAGARFPRACNPRRALGRRHRGGRAYVVLTLTAIRSTTLLA